MSFGEETIYVNGVLSHAATASVTEFKNPTGRQSSSDSFLVKTLPSMLHVAVEMLAGGRWVPIYVDTDARTGSTNYQLTPSNKV